jgi:acetyltransferase-like isoleucine patch superfamily enzyme
MNLTNNRYVSQRFQGNPLKAGLKRIFYQLFKRPYRNRLGKDSYIHGGFECWLPDRMCIGDRVTIGMNARFKLLGQYFEQCFTPKLVIDDDAYIGVNCEIVVIESVRIGKGCTLSDQIYINDSGHSMDPRQGLIMDRDLTLSGPILLEDHCFVGFGATILPGVTIGHHSVVAARSVVTKSVAPYTMVMGNPARPIARFDQDIGAWID